MATAAGQTPSSKSEDDTLKERLYLTINHTCNQLNQLEDEDTRRKKCNLHARCSFDEKKKLCTFRMDDYPVNAEYQKPCTELSKSECFKESKCYYDGFQCKRDATKLTSEEFQEIMNQTLRSLGYTDEQIRQNKIDYPHLTETEAMPYDVHSDNTPSLTQLQEFQLLLNPSSEMVIPLDRQHSMDPSDYDVLDRTHSMGGHNYDVLDRTHSMGGHNYDGGKTNKKRSRRSKSKSKSKRKSKSKSKIKRSKSKKHHHRQI